MQVAYADAAAYAEVYGHEHEAPARLAEFTCAVPEHLKHIETPHAAHPGCFATTMLLPIVPLVALDVAEVRAIVALHVDGAQALPRVWDEADIQTRPLRLEP